jgi:uncharacterized protein VirK/YbjX
MFNEGNIFQQAMHVVERALFVLSKSHKIIMHLPGHLRLIKVLKPFKGAGLIYISTYVMYTFNYVSNSITTAERLDIEICNYSFLRRVFKLEALKRIFKGGVEMWRESNSRDNFNIIFAFNGYEYEGSLALILNINDLKICTLVFTFSPGSPFDLPGVCVYASCIQGEKNRFDNYSKATKHFKDNAPPAVLLKVLEAMAVLLNIKVILGVSTESQVFFKRQQVPDAFNNKYNKFWESQGGKNFCKGSYILPCPVVQKPISTIVSKHRSRTIAKRKRLEEIYNSSYATIKNFFSEALQNSLTN